MIYLFIAGSLITILIVWRCKKELSEKKINEEMTQRFLERVAKEMRINEGNKILNEWLEKIES